MNPIEIVLIVIGSIIIIISCILVDRSKNSTDKQNGAAVNQSPISEQELSKVKDRINSILTEISEETVVRTDDSLSKLSNETIMAVNEFSEQILEKLKRNHEEVVFLYNMLNDKEKELKAAIAEVDSSRKKVEEIKDSNRETIKVQTVKKSPAANNPIQSAAPSVQQTKRTKPETKSTEGNTELLTLNSVNSNSNTQILSLYSQGKSIMEISKLLGLGQGEVKLVIDLFKGKK
jgi:hypothetical protein